MSTTATAFSSSNMADAQRPSQYYHAFVKTLPSFKGKTVAITGCSRGLGYITARTVAQKGGRVILLNRPTANLDWYQEICQAATGPDPIHIECNLQSFDSVRQASQRIIKLTENDGGLDVLCCNAGIMLQPDEASVDGYDITASTNMLSHFLLTKLLFGELKLSPKARIVIMSSASGYGGSSFNSTFFQKRGGNLGGSQASYERYHQSKLANLAFCCALHEKLGSSSIENNIQAVACTPGVCGTDMFVHATSVMNQGSPSPRSMVPSVEDGCMAQLKCILDPTVESGDLWGPGKNGQLVKTEMKPPLIRMDDDTKAALWQVCEDAVGSFDL
jgi:NAD(P)-dependent dehydrogenase (short-subunit alcohol dehydrogenase family)